WIYSAASVGTVLFSGNATGKDGNNNNNIASAITFTASYIQTPASLSSALSIIPSVLSTGQLFTIIMTVTNGGIATANVVTPTALVKFGSGNTNPISGPQ